MFVVPAVTMIYQARVFEFDEVKGWSFVVMTNLAVSALAGWQNSREPVDPNWHR